MAIGTLAFLGMLLETQGGKRTPPVESSGSSQEAWSEVRERLDSTTCVALTPIQSGRQDDLATLRRSAKAAQAGTNQPSTSLGRSEGRDWTIQNLPSSK